MNTTTPQLCTSIVVCMQYTSYDVMQKTYKTVYIENVNMKSKWTNVVLGSKEYFQVFIQKLCSHNFLQYIPSKVSKRQDSKEQEFSFRSSPHETQIQLYLQFPSFYAFFRANPIVFGSLLSHQLERAKCPKLQPKLLKSLSLRGSPVSRKKSFTPSKSLWK